ALPPVPVAAPPLREPLFGGAATDPELAPGRAGIDEAPQFLFQHTAPSGRTGRWVIGAVVFAAVIGVVAWLVTARRAPPPSAPEPVAAAPALAAPPTPASPAETPAAPTTSPPAAATATATPTQPPARPPPAVPPLAGSPQQDAPASEDPAERDYLAAVEAARDANAASRWQLEAEAYRRALAVRPASLEAKEGLGSAIVKSSGRAGS